VIFANCDKAISKRLPSPASGKSSNRLSPKLNAFYQLNISEVIGTLVAHPLASTLAAKPRDFTGRGVSLDWSGR
jgi:hypothetical protein